MNPDNSQDVSSSPNPNIVKLEDDLKKLSEEAVHSAPQESIVPTPPVVNGIPFGTPPQEPKRSSPVLAIAGILMFFAVAALAAYFLIPKYFGGTSTPKACTMEAKICPDGSSVGRSGPNCEFDACPTIVPLATETPMGTASFSATPTGSPTGSPSASPIGY